MKLKSSEAGPSRARGSFTTDGSWNERAEHESALERFVSSLVRARRAAKVSPKDLAERIAESEFPSAFPNQDWWADLPDWTLWPMAPTSTIAEEAVKRMGYGTEGHWEGGSWIPGRDMRVPGKISPQEVENLLGGLL